jgi:ketosteroid isomerase-like protein
MRPVSLDNVEIVRRAHELYRSGDFDAAIERYLDQEIAWETRWPGLEPWFYGHDGVREWVRQVTQPMEITMELIDARALDGKRVLAHYRAQGRGRGSAVPTEMKIFDVLWLRGGQIYRRRTFYSEGEALEASAAES